VSSAIWFHRTTVLPVELAREQRADEDDDDDRGGRHNAQAGPGPVPDVGVREVMGEVRRPIVSGVERLDVVREQHR
jgi:hypothetical protein